MNQCHVLSLWRLILPGDTRLGHGTWGLHVDLLLLGEEVPTSRLAHVVVPGLARLPGVLLSLYLRALLPLLRRALFPRRRGTALHGRRP